MFHSNPMERVLGRIRQLEGRLSEYNASDLPQSTIELGQNIAVERDQSQTFDGLLDSLRTKLSPRGSKWVIEDAIINSANEFKLDPDLLRAVISQESGGNPLAVSSAGAKGLMQLMDSTAASLGVKNSFDPHQNVRGGAKYLKDLLGKYSGRLDLALAAYNAGPAAVDKYNGIPPYAETQNYVKSILSKLKPKLA